ncbi:MAG: ComEC/Rec2 family competence protein, partial [Candidatus Saccharimonadales bacterium]
MKRYRRTTLIMVACVAVLLGLVAARRVSFSPEAWCFIFLPTLLLLKSKNLTSLLIVITLGLGVGLWRGGQFMHKLEDINTYSGRQITVQAVAKSDATYSKFNTQLEFTAGNITVQPEGRPLAGMFKISGFGIPMVYRGDTVQVTGKLYPARGSNQARMSYAQLETISADSSWLNKFTREFAAGIRNALPEPLSSFGLGILIGQRNTMSEEMTVQLTTVGLVHIVAVSGYNLTIMVRGISRLKLGSKYQQLMLSITLIGLFVVITGFSASIVRAALISGLGLWAWYYGRKARPLVLLLFTAAVTSLARPFYIWGDLGWYLSFLAFFGILVIAPAISRRLFKRPLKLLSLVVLETLAAEIMTLPLIMMIFGQLSIVALLANAIIVPLV